MWVKNEGTKRYSKTENVSYIKVNTDPGNPAIRISEKAKKELGWKEEDLVNIYIDREKIMIIKDENGNFSLRASTAKNKSYGFQIFGQALKDVIEAMSWEKKIAYPLQVVRRVEKNDNMIFCFRDEASDTTDDLVRRQVVKKYSAM